MKKIFLREMVLISFMVYFGVAFAEVSVPDKVKKFGFPGKSDWWFQLGYDLELDYIRGDSTALDLAGENNNSFALGNADLIPAFYLGPNVFFKARLDFESITGNAFFDEGTFNIKNLPWNTYISYGIDDAFAKGERESDGQGDRESEGNTLAQIAFFADDDYRLELGGDGFGLSWLYWRLSVSNGFELQTRAPGEVNAFPMLHDDDRQTDGNDSKEWGVGLGIHRTFFDKALDFDFLTFGYFGKLTATDRATLSAITGFGLGSSHQNNRFGFKLDGLVWEKLILRDLFVFGLDSNLDHFVNSFEMAYLFKTKGFKWQGYQFLTGIEPIFQYDIYETEATPDISSSAAASSTTWDRRRYLMGVNLDLFPATQLKAAYTVHEEDNIDEVSGDEIQNDDFLLQLKLVF
jgi:hypothetical protein